MRFPTRQLLRLTALPLATLALAAPRVGAQSFTWNNTGTAWQGAASWSPAGVPTGLDSALFRRGGSATGVAVTNPTLSGSAAALSVFAGLNSNFGGWNFTGAGTLTLGGTGSDGLVTLGPQTTTVSGPLLAGAGPNSASLNLVASSGSTLVLAGPTSAVTNVGTSLSVSGGTLRLDDTAVAVGNRLSTTAVVLLNGGGALELVGNAAGGTSSVGPLSVNSTITGGFNAVRVTPQGTVAPTVLLFANPDGVLGFSTRPGPRAAYSYEATVGNLGAPTGAQIRFVGTPYLGANLLLSTANNSGLVGFAIVKDAGGTDFATYGVTGVARAGATATATDATGLAALTALSRGQFNPTAGTTTAATGAVTAGSLRVTPAGAGAALALGTNALATNALMLDGPNDFALTGTGTLGVAGTHYVYVNGSAATLSTSLVTASGTNSTVFAGPGFVHLTGTASQNTLSGVNRFVIAGGTVRANATQVGFAATGGPGVVSLSGGVLEIKGGANGGGALADFTRPVGGSTGSVTWGANTALESGGGGFSAFGAAASVNLGGAASPLALRWNATDFVPAGYALKFGSAKSDAVLTWANPIQLDNGLAPTVREFNVTQGVGGDRTVLAGVVSGAANADFLKTGNGTLVLGAANTYAGGTLVHAGTLTLGATNALPVGGAVFLGNATLSTGVAAGFSSDLGALSLAAGTPTVALGTGAHTLSFTTLAVNVPGLTVTGFTGTPGASGTGGRLLFSGLGGSAASANASFASFLAGTSFVGFPLGASFIPGGTGLELVPAPVPEPATALGLAALGLAATRLARRRRTKKPRG